MTGTRFLLLVLILVAGTTVAVLYTNSLYSKRTDDMMTAMGDNQRPQPRPASRAASAPTTRPLLRAEEVITHRAADGTRIVSVRANGEFFRLPSSPNEVGPIVRGLIGRATAQAMKSQPPPPSELLTLRGQDLRTDMMPERATFDLTPLEGPVPPEALPWPRSYGIPMEGGTVEVPVVVPASRALLLEVKVGSLIHMQARAYRIGKIELLAP